VEAKAVDLPGNRSTDTYFFVMIDRLTGFLCALELRTKEVNPKTARGSLAVLKDLVAQMEKALGKPIRRVLSDAGTEFMAEVIPYLATRGIKKKIVPLGPTVESRNRVLQSRFYSLVRQHRGGTVAKLLAEAVEMCNQHTSRITGFRPVDAIKQPDRVLALKYNAKRQAPGKQLGPKIRVGDTVRYLTKPRKANLFYKGYRGQKNMSGVHKVTKIQGNSYTIDGKSYPRNRVIPVSALDMKSEKLLAARVQKSKPSKKKGPAAPPPLKAKSTRAKNMTTVSRTKVEKHMYSVFGDDDENREIIGFQLDNVYSKKAFSVMSGKTVVIENKLLAHVIVEVTKPLASWLPQEFENTTVSQFRKHVKDPGLYLASVGSEKGHTKLVSELIASYTESLWAHADTQKELKQYEGMGFESIMPLKQGNRYFLVRPTD